jgi:hypothetical protein
LKTPTEKIRTGYVRSYPSGTVAFWILSEKTRSYEQKQTSLFAIAISTTEPLPFFVYKSTSHNKSASHAKVYRKTKKTGVLEEGNAA